MGRSSITSKEWLLREELRVFARDATAVAIVATAVAAYTSKNRAASEYLSAEFGSPKAETTNASPPN